MTMKILVTKIFLLLLLPATTVDAQNVEVTITGIRNTEGQMGIGVFRDNESFMKEQAYREMQFVKKDISSGEMKVQFTLPPGTYGIALVDDENSDDVMEYNFLGVPKEGFGFSDYYDTGLKKPKFDSFKFTLDKGQKKNIKIRVRYIL
jgi:uncharacterized protein (DUF2141 family)